MELTDTYKNPRILLAAVYPAMATDPKEIPVAIQIFGSDPEIMGQMAAKVNDGRFQMIDINMGCPVPKIVNNGDGSALMKNPELAGKVIKAVVDLSLIHI